MSVKIWGIISGPTSRDDCPNSEDWPDHSNYTLICKTEIDGEVFDTNFYFEDLDDAYIWSAHFYDNIDTLVIVDDATDA